MDWVLAHLKLIMVVGFMVASWLAKRRQNRDEPPSVPTLPAPRMKTQVQTTAAPLLRRGSDEEIRRVQEEIRRKILQRASGGGTVAAPPPVPRESHRPEREVAPAGTRMEISRGEEMQAELARLEAQRRINRAAENAEIQEQNAAQASSSGGANTWRTELQNAESLRRAVILSEVLGPPLSLRRSLR